MSIIGWWKEFLNDEIKQSIPRWNKKDYGLEVGFGEPDIHPDTHEKKCRMFYACWNREIVLRQEIKHSRKLADGHQRCTLSRQPQKHPESSLLWDGIFAGIWRVHLKWRRDLFSTPGKERIRNTPIQVRAQFGADGSDQTEWNGMEWNGMDRSWCKGIVWLSRSKIRIWWCFLHKVIIQTYRRYSDDYYTVPIGKAKSSNRKRISLLFEWRHG